jgi:ankyrin repeat protein
MRFVFRSSLFAMIVLGGAGCTAFFERPTTPLHVAAWEGNTSAIRELVKRGADIDVPDTSGGTALSWAARGGHPIGPHRCGYETDGRPEVVAALLDLGANPNIQDNRPDLPGRSSGWTPLFVALHHRQFRSAQILLEHGADPNILSDQGMSVMGVAAAEGAPRELIELILKKGFDPATARERR